MNETNSRAELFSALHSLAQVAPEMRGGQLLAAVGELCADMHGRGLWDASDAELLEAAWRFQRDFAESRATSDDNLAADDSSSRGNESDVA